MFYIIFIIITSAINTVLFMSLITTLLRHQQPTCKNILDIIILIKAYEYNIITLQVNR